MQTTARPPELDLVDVELIRVLERIDTGLERIVAGLGAVAGLLAAALAVLIVHAT